VRRHTLALLGLVLVAACANHPPASRSAPQAGRTADQPTEATVLPAWLLAAPNSSQASACVPSTGNLLQDTRVATIKARAAIVHNESSRLDSETSVASQRHARAGQGEVTTQYDEHITEKASGVLSNIRTLHAESIEIEGRPHRCVQVAGPVLPSENQ
jgi:hypothetical protein